MDIYIKPIKKAIIHGRHNVTIEDIAEVVASYGLLEDIKKTIIFKKDPNINKKFFVISIIDIVSSIKKKYPNYTINNLGETNTVIEFKSGSEKENKIFKWAKIVFVTAVLLTGCATAIMTFHVDSQLNEIFDNYRKIFLGEDFTSPLFIELPYCIGVSVGIIVFFNHFSGKSITDDPTPIEVEMSTYESSVLDTVIEQLEVEEKEG